MSLWNKSTGAVHGAPIVAIHGAGMQGGVWGILDFPCRALSLPGHGETPGAPLPSIEEMAAWVISRLSAPVVLMGHSMGALVALEAGRHPSVAGLVLLGAAVKMPVHPDLLTQTVENPDAAAEMILKWGVFSGNPEAPSIRDALKKQMQPETLANDMRACDSYRHGAKAAKEIQKPVLVLSGEHDKMTRCADGQALAGMIPGAQFSVLPGCGHMPMAEKPVETAREISRFLAG